MKKIFYIILFVSFISVSANSQYWVEQTSGVNVQLTSVSPIQNEVWVCGYSGTVLRSTNSGANWLNVSGGGIPNTVSLVNIWAFDANTAVVAGYLGTDTWVWRTSNAGANWVQVFTQPGGFINGMVFRKTSPNSGFMQGDPVGGRWSLFKTYNGGINWDSTGLYLPQNGTEAGWNNSIFMGGMVNYYSASDSTIWFGTNNTRIYYSANLGSTWSAQSTAPEVNSYALGMFGGLPLDGLTGGTTLLRTTNAGSNWSTQTALGTGNFAGFVMFPVPVSDESSFFGYSWYVRNDVNIYRSFNGSSWAIEYTAPAGNYRHISVGRNSSQVWAVRSNGGITKCNCFVSGISETGNNVPERFGLSQNYPNPFNPVTKIKFGISGRSAEQTLLTVFDMLGRRVAVLVNEKLQPGTYEADWDASEFPSGVYYYKLESGSFSETKKMIFIK